MDDSSRDSPRARTRLQLLELIRTRRGVTRTDLAEVTGMSRSTVGNAVAQLVASGLVEEAALAEKGPGSGRGRPGAVLRALGAATAVAAVDFGHRHITVALGSGDGGEIARRHVAHEASLPVVERLDWAADALEAIGAQHAEDVAVAALGIPKPLNRITGRVQAPRISDGWTELSPTEEFTQRCGIRAVADNDTVLGAIGEHASGAAQGLSDFVYVKVSHGIGAGLFLNGAPYRGATGIVGSIGHCRIDGRDDLCRCGRRGCLEAIATMPAVLRQLEATEQGVDAAELLAHPDDAAERVISGAGRSVGRVLADVCTLLNPQALVLGGVLGSQHQAFVEGVRWAVQEYSGSAVADRTSVRPAELGLDAEVRGGLALASQAAMSTSRTL